MTSLPIIRNSERRSFGRCQQQWWWAWRCGLRPINQESVPLIFGSWVHEALAAWYCGPGVKRGPHPAETFAQLAGDEVAYVKTSNRLGSGAEALIEEKLVPATELGVSLLTGYVEHYGRDDAWHVIQAEQTFQIDVPGRRGNAFSIQSQIAILAGTYDLVYRDLNTGNVYLGEHKTAKAISLAHLPLDNQAGTYWAVAAQTLRHLKLIGPKEKLAGIRYNFIRKALPDTRPQDADGYATNKPVKRQYLEAMPDTNGHWSIPELEAEAQKRGIEILGERSKNQPQPIYVRHTVPRSAEQREQQISRIRDEALHMEALRAGTLPILKNTTYTCQWDCDFFDMCVLHEAGADWRAYRDAAYKVQDPYADHRKSTDE
jgi:Zierdtviridae exonuclease